MNLHKTISVHFLIMAYLSIGLVGCGGPAGPPPPERAVTAGSVSFDGKPVANGGIMFVPEDGPSAGGPIKDGQYRIENKGGIPVGACKVEIQAFEETGEEVVSGADGKTTKETVQVIPEQYNTKSTLMVTIKGGEENKHDFDLKK